MLVFPDTHPLFGFQFDFEADALYGPDHTGKLRVIISYDGNYPAYLFDEFARVPVAGMTKDAVRKMAHSVHAVQSAFATNPNERNNMIVFPAGHSLFGFQFDFNVDALYGIHKHSGEIQFIPATRNTYPCHLFDAFAGVPEAGITKDAVRELAMVARTNASAPSPCAVDSDVYVNFDYGLYVVGQVTDVEMYGPGISINRSVQCMQNVSRTPIPLENFRILNTATDEVTRLKIITTFSV